MKNFAINSIQLSSFLSSLDDGLADAPNKLNDCINYIEKGCAWYNRNVRSFDPHEEVYMAMKTLLREMKECIEQGLTSQKGLRIIHPLTQESIDIEPFLELLTKYNVRCKKLLTYCINQMCEFVHTDNILEFKKCHYFIHLLLLDLDNITEPYSSYIE